MGRDTYEKAWAILRTELLPAWGLYGVREIEAVDASHLEQGGVVFQLRDARGVRVARHAIPSRLFIRTEEVLTLLLAETGREKIVLSVGVEASPGEDQ